MDDIEAQKIKRETINDLIEMFYKKQEDVFSTGRYGKATKELYGEYIGLGKAIEILEIEYKKLNSEKSKFEEMVKKVKQEVRKERLKKVIQLTKNGYVYYTNTMYDPDCNVFRKKGKKDIVLPPIY